MNKPEAAEKPSCGQCKFFDPEEGDTEVGYCLRYPPQVYIRVVSIDDSDVDFANPPMESGEWCGEFVQKDTPSDLNDLDLNDLVDEYGSLKQKDYRATVGTGVRIDATGKKLWVCVDGVCVLRVISPEIELTDDRPDH